MIGTVARSTPYAWPYDGSLVPSRLALLVVLPGAADDGMVPDPALSRIGDLAEGVLGAGGLVVEVATRPPLRAAVSAPATEPFLLGSATVRVTSDGVDGFFASPLDNIVRSSGRDQLLLCGQWLETGVHSTMRSANDRGLECLLVLDACTAYDPGLVAASRSQIEMSGGIFGAVGETAAVLDALAANIAHAASHGKERTSA